LRPRLLLLALLGALAAAATVGAQLSHAAPGAAWRDTATKGLSLNGASLGPVAAATPLHVAVALSTRNGAQLAQSIRSGTELAPEQFAAAYGPTQADTQAVESYLTQNGFSNVAVEPNGLFVTADGTAAVAEKAFNTSIVAYSVEGATLFANATAAQVPAQLTGVLSVLGLNDAATMSLPLRKAAVGVPSYVTDYTPQGFWKAYDATTAPTGSKTPIAIFAEGDVTGVVGDLRTFEKADGLAQVPVSIVRVGVSSPDTAGADEWDMDTQFSTGMAGTVSRLYLYDTTSLTDSDITLEFNRFVTDDKAKAGSASFGECEYQAYLDGSMVAMDQVFAEAAAQGQTVFASSGDTGGFCPVVPDNGVPAGAPDVNYPASSQYVVSAGGTSLLTNADGTYDDELAWLAGGGGPSIFESQPFWQQGVAPPTGSTCVEYVACVGKTLPDVAMDADPNSGAEVYVDGSPEAIGGTSLSSPLTLGVWARLQSAHANKLGFAAPKLYAAAGSAGYRDVTLGNTGPYPAAPGYDLATGLGTFDVANMVTAIAAG
jgi:pseudomonalisin